MYSCRLINRSIDQPAECKNANAKEKHHTLSSHRILFLREKSSLQGNLLKAGHPRNSHEIISKFTVK